MLHSIVPEKMLIYPMYLIHANGKYNLAVDMELLEYLR